jgi:hypothetical protein
LENTIAAIGRAKSLAVVAIVLVMLTGCSSYHPRTAAPTPFQRTVILERKGSVVGDFTFTYPPSWSLQQRRSGQVAVLTPPAGKGRLRLMALLDQRPPEALSRAYARAVCARALRTVGLQANIVAVRTVAADHMVVKSAGIAAGTTVTEFVHVFSNGRTVMAFFRAPTTDSHLATANRIMKSVGPKAGS